MASINNTEIIKSINYAEKNQLFEKLNNIYDTLPKGKCTGCGNCCMESVGINLIEFLNIYNYLQDKDELRKKSIGRIMDYYFMEFMEKKSCPFKDENNMCLIYEVRPLNCRLFGHWKKEDYNKNLKDITEKNQQYKNIMKGKYGFDISDEVVNYKIKYCEDFIPDNEYLSKSERLGFADDLMVLDSRLFSKGVIDIEFRDRGIVEYFIDSLLHQNISYNIKVRISKEPKIAKRTIGRLKRMLIK
ncbi:MAG: YkgJ family cysteine cluster protein [Clostridiales bacterium]|uniref:YkgJ family cysteine cluster protein n=1 Tax=Terrisporobacter sp. TaxID=1965305 RepID=UPI002A3CEC26|nr:YkgJ family cysteine cluster protein [Terrisporobacter sp.]MCI5628215.1 YkgJ family cysteine cluster protein [Clostridium sp.]MDD5877605.1 YkgJ family cysteine cluster protein [Clostridiales bacterium]MCI6457450.1 YkgJ family cysteine cluster protein [Clostridium sp.]MCI7206721.1 YkgJ family cysteine cluster protein [Clostridium sp.]MDD7755534.1 YkgJ family cysteine cluster protein [Clostridiales bacterium]